VRSGFTFKDSCVTMYMNSVKERVFASPGRGHGMHTYITEFCLFWQLETLITLFTLIWNLHGRYHGDLFKTHPVARVSAPRLGHCRHSPGQMKADPRVKVINYSSTFQEGFLIIYGSISLTFTQIRDHVYWHGVRLQVIL